MQRNYFMKNGPSRRKGRRNGPELVILGSALGNKPKRPRRSGRKSRQEDKMAKHRKRNAKGRFVKKASASHRVRHNKPRRHHKRGYSSRPRSRRRHGRRNAPGKKFLGGFVQLPSVQEMLWVGGGAIALPTITEKVIGFLPATMQGAWMKILTEALTGSVASALVRKFVSTTAGDLLFTVTLVRVLPKVVGQLTGGKIGEVVSDYETIGDSDQLSMYFQNRALPAAGMGGFRNEVPSGMEAWFDPSRA